MNANRRRIQKAEPFLDDASQHFGSEATGPRRLVQYEQPVRLPERAQDGFAVPGNECAQVHYFDGEAVLLELDTGRYFGLNGIGTRMWLLLLEHGRVEPAYHTLLGEYEVAEDRLCGELLGFVNCLASRHLLLLHDD